MNSTYAASCMIVNRAAHQDQGHAMHTKIYTWFMVHYSLASSSILKLGGGADRGGPLGCCLSPPPARSRSRLSLSRSRSLPDDRPLLGLGGSLLVGEGGLSS